MNLFPHKIKILPNELILLLLFFFSADPTKKDDPGAGNPSTKIVTKSEADGKTEDKNTTDAGDKKLEKTPVMSKLREPLITQLPLNKSNKTLEYSAYVS